jgi:hypothetical protein
VHTLELVRIAAGAVVLLWGLILLPDAADFFSQERLGRQPAGGLPLAWLSSSPLMARLNVGAVAVAGAMLMFGWRSRAASVVVLVGMLSLHAVDPGVFNSGDRLLLNVALFLALSPLGATTTLMSRCRSEVMRAPKLELWQVRMLQLQLSTIYLATVVHKLSGETWTQGRAGFALFRHEDLFRFVGIPIAFADSLAMSVLVSFGTLVIEVAVAVLIWVPQTRRLAVIVGVALHLAIEALIIVGFFAPAMALLYLAFTPPDTANQWLDQAVIRLRHPWLRRPRPSDEGQTQETLSRPALVVAGGADRSADVRQ